MRIALNCRGIVAMKVSMKSFLPSLLLQSFNIYLQTTNNIVNMGILTINIDLPGLNEGAHDLLADPR